MSQTVPLAFTFDPPGLTSDPPGLTSDPPEASTVDTLDWSVVVDRLGDDDDTVDVDVKDDDNGNCIDNDNDNDLSPSSSLPPLPPSPTVLTAEVTRWPAPSKVTPLVAARYYIPSHPPYYVPLPFASFPRSSPLVLILLPFLDLLECFHSHPLSRPLARTRHPHSPPFIQ